MAGRNVSLSQWEVAAFRNGRDTMAMIFGTPASDSALANLPSIQISAQPRLEQELANQALYIQRPEHEAQRLW